MFELAHAYKDAGMAAYSRVQEKEFACEFSHGYSAVKHQRFVGTGYFDEVTQVIAGGKSSLSALEHSTEVEQFAEIEVPAQMIR
jgi:isocitrate lyase